MIAISGLTKRYRDVLAVDDASLEVPSGSVCGLLGRNGAGKTTAFKCLLGFAQPDAGEVSFDGSPLSTETFLKLGYVPERAQLYGWLSGEQHLELTKRSHPRYDEKRARELASTFRLDLRRRAKRLSKGQQTALSLVVALSTNPSLLVLDEPASGLDPVMQRAILDLLIDAATNGATILLSSHQIGQIERAADRVAIMRDGRIVVSGDIDDLRENAKIVEATFDEGIPDFGALNGVTRIERVGRTARLFAGSDAPALAARCNDLGARAVRVLDRTLEDLFLEAVDDGGHA
jgi:ABC-2 type transport system ATP-binding protein